MNVINDATLISVLATLILIVCGSHVALLAWLGRNMYAKIGSIENLVRESIAVISDRYQDLEGRVIRIETHIELKATNNHHRDTHQR